MGKKEIRISILKLPEAVSEWGLVHGFMRFRKSVFVDQMGWNLYHDSGAEFEQYDGLDVTYVVAHRDGEVVGGARLMPTTRRLGVYSYMIRDACRGLLEGMPRNLCDVVPPVRADVWELTRFAANEQGVGEAILRVANDHLRSLDASACLFLGPPAFMRMAKKLGWAPHPLGGIRGNHDGRFLAFECAVVGPATRAPAGLTSQAGVHGVLDGVTVN